MIIMLPDVILDEYVEYEYEDHPYSYLIGVIRGLETAMTMDDKADARKLIEEIKEFMRR